MQMNKDGAPSEPIADCQNELLVSGNVLITMYIVTIVITARSYWYM